jgi:pimeloyl-ACP methyl ester carboxylesterase
MKRRTFVTTALATGTVLATSRAGLAQTPAAEGAAMTGTTPESGYAPVNGMQMYYEIHGTGEPLLLLHGAYGTIDMWGAILEGLAADHQVIAVEFQAHGHTADIDRPIRYETLGEDAAAFMDELGIAQADVVGYSMGANAGIWLAMQRPELVRKLVAISANTRSDAYYPEVYQSIEAISPELFAGTPFEQAYLRNAPNPDNWPVLIEKLKDMDAQEFAWPDAGLQAIPAPVMLISGDSDVMRPEHTVALFRLFGGGVPGDLTGLPASQLAIIPGTTHLTIAYNHIDRLVSMIEQFLAAPLPEPA